MCSFEKGADVYMCIVHYLLTSIQVQIFVSQVFGECLLTLPVENIMVNNIVNRCIQIKYVHMLISICVVTLSFQTNINIRFQSSLYIHLVQLHFYMKMIDTIVNLMSVRKVKIVY